MQLFDLCGYTAAYDRKFSAEGFGHWKSALEIREVFTNHNASQHHMDNYQKWKMHLMTTPIDEHLSVQKADQIKVKSKEREKPDNVLFRIARI